MILKRVKLYGFKGGEGLSLFGNGKCGVEGRYSQIRKRRDINLSRIKKEMR